MTPMTTARPGSPIRARCSSITGPPMRTSPQIGWRLRVVHAPHWSWSANQLVELRIAVQRVLDINDNDDAAGLEDSVGASAIWVVKRSCRLRADAYTICRGRRAVVDRVIMPSSAGDVANMCSPERGTKVVLTDSTIRWSRTSTSSSWACRTMVVITSSGRCLHPRISAYIRLKATVRGVS